MRNFSFWYFFTGVWLITGWRLFFRRYQSRGREKLNYKDPLIFTPNHSNAFLDPFCTELPIFPHKQLHFMVRADVFKHPVAAFILNSWKLIPAYRMRDGVENLAKNDEIFARVQAMMKRHDGIIIFTEANHAIPRRMRQVKKGLSRIVFGMNERYGADYDMKVKIVPTGLVYTEPHNFGGDLLVNYGEPIAVADYMELYRSHPAKAMNKLTQDVFEAIKLQMIHIENEECYEAIEMAMHVYANNFPRQTKQPANRFVFDKKLIVHLEDKLKQQPNMAAEFNEVLLSYQDALQKHNLRDWLFTHKSFSQGSILGWSFLLGLMLPLVLPGLLVHAWPLVFGNRFAHRNIKDPAFYSSIKLSIFVILISLQYYIALALMIVFAPWWAAVAVIPALCFNGMLALWWGRKSAKVMAMMRYNTFAKKQSALYNQLHMLRNTIVGWCEV